MAKRKKSARTVRRAAAKRPRRVPVVRAMEAALAGIAHDIRTPLTGIVALAELLAASDLGTRERDWASAIKSGADHLAQTASLIVDAVRADAKGLVLRREPFSPRDLAQAIGAALAARAGSKSLAPEVVIGELPAMVAGDSLRLRAALENLADNAVKFTANGVVRFAVAAKTAARGRVILTFAFTDTGIGLTPGEVKRLFKPFAQASEDVARRYGGAGLGLVFVRRIARAMNGDLTVKSQKSKGSTFTFTARFETIEDRAAREHLAPAAKHRRLAVLCAEDNPYGRVVLNTILRELGHDADFVDSGEAAVRAVARGKYDVVLMDVNMPDFDGVEATRRIRALSGPASAVTIIGVSGHDDASHVAAARQAGMADFLPKPISPRRLSEMLTRVAPLVG